MTLYSTFEQTQRLRIRDGATVPILSGCEAAPFKLIVVLPQLGDFASLEYAWWLRRDSPARESLALEGVALRAVAIGDRAGGQRFCDYTGFDPAHLFIDPAAGLHQQLGLYAGLGWKLPGLSAAQNGWLNLMLMCAGIGSPGTLSEVFRGYRGDRSAPQLIAPDETVRAKPLPPIQGSTFDKAGGSGFQRPFELATLRLRNMAESLGHWSTYVPDAAHLTQRGGTFLFESQSAQNHQNHLIYEHRDRGILGFSETMANPLTFLLAHTESHRSAAGAI